MFGIDKKPRAYGVLFLSEPAQPQRDAPTPIPDQKSSLRRRKYSAVQQTLRDVPSEHVHLVHAGESLFRIYFADFTYRYAREQQLHPNFTHCCNRRVDMAVFILDEDCFQRAATPKPRTRPNGQVSLDTRTQCVVHNDRVKSIQINRGWNVTQHAEAVPAMSGQTFQRLDVIAHCRRNARREITQEKNAQWIVGHTSFT